MTKFGWAPRSGDQSFGPVVFYAALGGINAIAMDRHHFLGWQQRRLSRLWPYHQSPRVRSLVSVCSRGAPLAGVRQTAAL